MISNKISQFLNELSLTLKQYPAVLFFAFQSAIAMVLLIDSEQINYTTNSDLREQREFLFGKIAYVASIGIPLSFVAAMLLQKFSKSQLLQFSVLAIVISLYFLFPASHKLFTVKHAIIMIMVFLLAHLLVAVLPFFQENNERNFWEYNKNLFIHIVLTGIFTAVLIGGLELAILALEKLFNFQFDNGLIYPKIFAFFGIFGSAVIFSLFTKNGLFGLQTNQEYPAVLKFFVQFILIPLLLIYCVILFLYGLKILVQWELPNGWVSSLITVYSFLGILALLLVHPLIEKTTKNWVKWFSQLFYISLVPFTILLFVAIGRRISDYGFTENRYYVLLIAIWLATTTIYFLVIKDARIKFIPSSLLVFGLFSIAFPFFNGNAVSLRSQERLFQLNLTELNLLNENDVIDYDRPILRSQLDELQSQVEFFEDRNELHRIGQWVAIEQSNDEYRRVSRNFVNEFSEIEEDENSYHNTYTNGTFLSSQPIKVIDAQEYDYVIHTAHAMDSIQLPTTDLTIYFNRNENLIQVVDDWHDVKDEFSLNSWFEELENLYLNETISEYPEYEFQFNNWECKLILESLNRYVSNGDKEEYNFSGVLLLKQNE